jgi:hypothetical protein
MRYNRLLTKAPSIVVAAMTLSFIPSCASPEQNAQQLALQAAVQENSRADVQYALHTFAEEGSRNRIYIDAQSSEVKQEAVAFVQSIGGIPTESREGDLILKIETEYNNECRRELFPRGPIISSKSSNIAQAYVRVSALLIKIAGLGNSPTVVFASEASDCQLLIQQSGFEAYVARAALSRFRAPPCVAETKDLRPYYFRCADGQEARSQVASRELPSMQLQPSRSMTVLADLLRTSTEANRLSRVYIDGPDHLNVAAANFINSIGGTPVLSRPAEFSLRLERQASQRCGDDQRPVGISIDFVTANGNILASHQKETCTTLFRNDAERRLVVVALQELAVSR